MSSLREIFDPTFRKGFLRLAGILSVVVAEPLFVGFIDKKYIHLGDSVFGDFFSTRISLIF